MWQEGSSAVGMERTSGEGQSESGFMVLRQVTGVSDNVGNLGFITSRQTATLDLGEDDV